MENILISINEGVYLSAFGGLAYYILPLLELIKKPKETRIDILDLSFWTNIGISTFLGGLVGYVYFSGLDSASINKILCLQTGITSPMILRAMIEGYSNPKESVSSSIDQSDSLENEITQD